MSRRRVALPRSPKPYPACRSKYSRPAPLPVLAAEQERSRKLTWSDALKVSFGVDVLTCPCGGKRRLIAVITQAKVIKKILRHLGLPTDVVLKETQPVWRVRGPPEELFPEGVDETGQDLAVDEDFGMDFVDELPVDDWAA